MLSGISPVALAVQQSNAVTYTVNDEVARIKGSAYTGGTNLAIVLQVLRLGVMPTEISPEDFLDYVKEKTHLKIILVWKCR